MANYTDYKNIAKLFNKTADFLEVHKWTRGENARDKNGNDVEPRSRRATCWCAEVALNKCCRSDRLVSLATSVYHAVHGGKSLHEFNDRQKRKRNVVRELRRTARELVLKKGNI